MCSAVVLFPGCWDGMGWDGPPARKRFPRFYVVRMLDGLSTAGVFEAREAFVEGLGGAAEVHAEESGGTEVAAG